MSRKLISFALPLSFVLLFSSAESSFAATPIATFGVMATVEAGCSVSAATLHESYNKAMANAASSVSVSCTNIAQYVITVSSLKPTTSDAGAVVPVGKLSFPLASLTNYAMPLGSARSIKPSVIAATGLAAGANSRSVQPLRAYGETADKPTAASNPNPDAISVSIIY